MGYPPDNLFVSVDPDDPKGVHLLLLLSGTLAPEAVRTALEGPGVRGSFAILPPARWSQVRGAGVTQASDLVPAMAVLREIEEGLPEGLQLMHALFVHTAADDVNGGRP
jgi:hypothetical protein